MTMVGKATAIPRSSRRKFLAVLARICGRMVRNLPASRYSPSLSWSALPFLVTSAGAVPLTLGLSALMV